MIPLQLLHHVVFTCNRKIQLISISYKYTRHIERVERWEANHEFIDIHEGHLGNDGALFNYWTPSNQSNSEQIWVVKGFLRLRGETARKKWWIFYAGFNVICSRQFVRNVSFISILLQLILRMNKRPIVNFLHCAIWNLIISVKMFSTQNYISSHY